MTVRAGFLTLMLLAGCATAAPQPPPGAASSAAPAHGTMSAAAPPPGATATPSPASAAGPSDWALAIVGTPFVFAFRVVTCAATAVVAGPTAGLLAFSEEREAGLAYLRDGLAQNCGPPYAVPVPVASRYARDPYVAGPRPLVRHDHDKVMTPRRVAAAARETAEN
jgi:hypothetical protein